MQAVNLTTGSVFYRQIRAHEHPINVLHRFNAHLIGSGDDEGSVKLWDMRQRGCAMHYTENEDFVSDMLHIESKNILLVTRFGFKFFFCFVLLCFPLPSGKMD